MCLCFLLSVPTYSEFFIQLHPFLTSYHAPLFSIYCSLTIQHISLLCLPSFSSSFLPPLCLLLAPHPSIHSFFSPKRWIFLSLLWLYLVRGSHFKMKGQHTMRCKCHWNLAYWTHIHAHRCKHWTDATCFSPCVFAGWSQADPWWAPSQIWNRPEQREWDKEGKQAVLCICFWICSAWNVLHLQL